MGRKRRLGESTQDLSGRSGQRVRYDRCNHRQSPPAQRRGSRKGGFERSDRPLARRIDDQDSRHRRCAGQSAGGEPHRRTRSRRNAGPSLDPGNRTRSPPRRQRLLIATASSIISKSAASSPSFRRGQIARRRASGTSRSIASATSWNVSSTSSSTFAPSQPATKRPPETSSQASTSSAPWLGSNDDRP